MTAQPNPPVAALGTCLVTGASSGLGAALAVALAREGWTVWGTARDTARVNLPGVRPLAVDLADAGLLDRFIRNELATIGPIHLLVNNAGAGVFGDFARFDNSQVAGQMQLLLMSPIALTHAVLPSMLEAGRGCVVNVSSLAARHPLPQMTPYNSAKAGLSAFSQQLAVELRGTGVRVIDFQPGDIRTPFNDNMPRAGGSPRAWATIERHLRAAPPPERVADTLLQAIRAGRSGTVVAGGFLQSRLAPLGQALLPGCIFRALERLYLRS